MQYSNDSDCLLTRFNNGTVVFWNINDYSMMKKIEFGQEYSILHLQSNDDSFLRG